MKNELFEYSSDGDNNNSFSPGTDWMVDGQHKSRHPEVAGRDALESA